MDNVGDDAAVLDSATPLSPDDSEQPIVDRERLQAAARAAIDALVAGDRPHLFVTGPRGTGKSLLTRRLLAEALPESTRSIVLDCAACGSVYGVAVALANALDPDGEPLARTGHSEATVLSRLDERLRAGAETVLVLDELDAVDAPRLLDHLIDGVVAGEHGTICLADDPALRNELPYPLRRRFCARELVFEPYDWATVRQILADRVDRSFRDGAVSPAVLDRCTDVVQSSFDGDLGRGIELLAFVARVAEDDGATHVAPSHVTAARDRLVGHQVASQLSDVSRHRSLALGGLLDSGTADGAPRIDALYEAYQRRCGQADVDPISRRGFHDHLTALRDADFVTVTSHRSGTPGHYYRYHLAVEPAAVQFALDAVLEKEADAP